MGYQAQGLKETVSDTVNQDHVANAWAIEREVYIYATLKLTKAGVIACWATIIILHNTAQDTLLTSKQLTDSRTSYTTC